MRDEKATGKLLGRILLPIVSFAVGAVIGLLAAAGIMEIARAIGWQWLTDPLVSVVRALGGGLLFVFCGARISRAYEKYQWNRYWK